MGELGTIGDENVELIEDEIVPTAAKNDVHDRMKSGTVRLADLDP